MTPTSAAMAVETAVTAMIGENKAVAETVAIGETTEVAETAVSANEADEVDVVCANRPRAVLPQPDGRFVVAITAAYYAGDAVARMRHSALIGAPEGSEQRRWLMEALNRERHAALAIIAAATNPSWWDEAPPDSVGDVVLLARGLVADPDIARLELRIRALVEQRCGLAMPPPPAAASDRPADGAGP